MTTLNPCDLCRRIAEIAYSRASDVQSNKLIAEALQVPNRLIHYAKALQERFSSIELVQTVRERSFSYYQETKNIIQEDFNNASQFVGSLTKFTKSFDDFDTFLRFTHESITFTDLVRYSDKVSRPVLTYFGAFIGVINIGRFVNSINDLVSGKMYREYVEKKYLDAAVSVSFLFARTYSTFTWVVQQNLVSKAFLSRPLQALAQTRVLQVLAQNKAFQYTGPLFMRIPVISLLYLTAFTALAIKNLDEIKEGKAKGTDVSHLNWEYKSMVAYVALCAIGLTPFGTPLVSAGLAAIAAGTGMTACFVKIANNQ